MRRTAYVVNTGIITAIGDNTSSCLESLVSGKSAIGKAEYLQTFWKDTLPVGEVKRSNEQLAAISGVNKHCPRTALLSAAAVKEAWKPFEQKAAGLRTGFFSASTNGGMDLTENFFRTYKKGQQPANLQQVMYHECGAVTELVSNHFRFTDFTTTISTACSSSANSIMMAAQMIANDMIDVAVAGGADCLTRFTINGFNTLMILDKQPCQPFDKNRRGLNLGEGAGYLLLVNERALKQLSATPICTISGYANTNDAYHQTASSPDGIGNKLAIQGALNKAELNTIDIDYINLHGTGTENNDSSEGKAIEAIFEKNIPMASSTKAYTGHTLGASGGIEAVFSVLSLQHGVVFPNLRWETPMDDISWQPVIELKRGLNIRNVLSNSFGFGGNCSSLIFSKC